MPVIFEGEVGWNFIDNITGEEIPRNEELNIINGMFYSTETVRRYTCNRCGRLTKEGEYLNGSWYCNNCVRQIPRCNECGTMIEENRGGYCLDCMQKKFIYYCNSCGENHDGNESCHRQDILNYSHKPTPLFRVDKNEDYHKVLVFGLEIETDTQSKDKSIIARRLKDMGRGLMYPKSDSSISGFEMVFHPFSYKWFKKNRQVIHDILETAKAYGMDGYRSGQSGVHIHTNKEMWSTMQIYNLYKVLKNEKLLVKKVTRRTDNKLNKWAKIITSEGNIKLLSKVKGGTNHSSALNFTNNTMEIRIFRGTLEIDVLEGYIQFVIAAHEYTMYKRKETLEEFIMNNMKYYDKLYDLIALYEEKKINYYLEVPNNTTLSWDLFKKSKSSRKIDFLNPFSEEDILRNRSWEEEYISSMRSYRDDLSRRSQAQEEILYNYEGLNGERPTRVQTPPIDNSNEINIQWDDSEDTPIF